MESNLLDVGWNVLETNVNEGPPRIDSVRGRILCRLKRFQLHHLSWQLQKNIKTKATETRMETFMKLILPATMASDSASRARMALVSSSTALRVA